MTTDDPPTPPRATALYQRAVYDGLWGLFAETLIEQQRRIEKAQTLPDAYLDTPDSHERTYTIEAIVAVFTEAQRDLIRACAQGWYSESETYACWWSWVRALESNRRWANKPRYENESVASYERWRHYAFLRAHLYAWLIRQIKPIYRASLTWREESIL